MRKEDAKKWLEKRGYKVTLQMGDNPYYIVTKGFSTFRGTINSIQKAINKI